MRHLKTKPIVCGLLSLLIPIMWLMPALAITGGEVDGDRHPYVGAFSAFCSGTLIHSKVFLTAGHCTAVIEEAIASGKLTLDQIKVNFNSKNVLDPTTALNVAKIITHPDFKLGLAPNPPHDLGVLILQAPVSDITPAILPEKGFLDKLRAEGNLGKGANFTVVGYGTTLKWPPPTITPSDDQRYMAVSEFLNLRQLWLHLSQNQAGGTGDAGSCYGDSGGAVLWTESDGREILVAVVSWGDYKCVATGTNYRLDIDDSLSFINDVIGSLSAAAPPAVSAVSAVSTKKLTTTWGRMKSKFLNSINVK